MPFKIRTISVLALAVSALLLPISAANAGQGVHLVSVKPQGDRVWIIREFIDNAVIGAMAGDLDEPILLPFSISPGPGTTISMLSSGSVPLVTFTSLYIDPAEGRISETGRLREESQLRRELDRQVIGALFQVPIWPFLVASEVPMGRIEFEQEFRLPDWREDFFPVASYAASGDFPAWDVTRNTENGAYVQPTGNPGEGSGIMYEYLVEGDLSGMIFGLSILSHVDALYIDSPDSGWRLPAGPAESSFEIPVHEMLGAIEQTSAANYTGIHYSFDCIDDSSGVLSRTILAVFGDTADTRIMLPVENFTDLQRSQEVPVRNFSLLFAILGCWLGFGALIVAGNYVNRFTSRGPAWLFGTAVALFPMYLLVSFLMSGLWGLGFIPAAVLVSRFISGEGRRLTGTGVVLSVNFIILFISWIIAG